MKYEYSNIRTNELYSDVFLKALNDAGKDGWEVINVFHYGTNLCAYLKRPLRKRKCPQN